MKWLDWGSQKGTTYEFGNGEFWQNLWIGSRLAEPVFFGQRSRPEKLGSDFFAQNVKKNLLVLHKKSFYNRNLIVAFFAEKKNAILTMKKSLEAFFWGKSRSRHKKEIVSAGLIGRNFSYPFFHCFAKCKDMIPFLSSLLFRFTLQWKLCRRYQQGQEYLVITPDKKMNKVDRFFLPFRILNVKIRDGPDTTFLAG